MRPPLLHLHPPPPHWAACAPPVLCSKKGSKTGAHTHRAFQLRPGGIAAESLHARRLCLTRHAGKTFMACAGARFPLERVKEAIKAAKEKSGKGGKVLLEG